MFLGTHRVLTPQNAAAEPKEQSAPETHSLDAADTGWHRGPTPSVWPPKVWGPLLRSLEPEPLSPSVGAGRAGLAWDGFGFC